MFAFEVFRHNISFTSIQLLILKVEKIVFL